MSRWWLGGMLLGALALLLALAIGVERARARVEIRSGFAALAGGATEERTPSSLAAPGREPATPGRARPAVLELHVVRDDGEPLEQFEVLVRQAGKLLRAGRAWGGGTLALVPFSGPGTAEVRLAGREVARRELAQGVGRFEIVVPSGASVSGIVRVGGVPRGGMGLELVAGPAEGPGFVGRALERVGWREPRQVRWARTKSDGSFRFACLPDDWSGTLSLTSHERDSFAGEIRRIALDRPRQDLVLELHERALEIALRGRAVLGGEGVPGAHWRASGGGRGVEFVRPELGDCDELGRFSLAATEGVQWLRIELLQPGVGFGVLERSAEVWSGPVIELGDVELARVRDVPFRVISDEGAPVAGARARAWSDRSMLEWAATTGLFGNFAQDAPPDFLESGPTDADGRGELRALAHDAFTFAVHARGFTPARVTFGPADPLPLEIRLVRCATLEVHLCDPYGDVPPGLEVALASAESLFLAELGDAPLPASRRTFPWSMGVDEGGRALLEGLRAGVSFDVVPVDDYRTELEGPRDLVLAPGERRVVELVVHEPSRTLVTRVQDVLGFPLWGAQISVSASGSSQTRTTGADRTGMLRIPDFYGSLVDLRFESQYFRPRKLERVPVPPEGATVKVVLARDWWPW